MRSTVDQQYLGCHYINVVLSLTRGTVFVFEQDTLSSQLSTGVTRIKSRHEQKILSWREQKSMMSMLFIITDGDNKKEGSKMKSSSVQEFCLKICKLFIDDLIISVILITNGIKNS